jgi:predicted nucleic acid-binding Zn ribbon protein
MAVWIENQLCENKTKELILQHANQVRKYVLLWVVSFAIVELYN